MTYLGIDPGKNWGWAVVGKSEKNFGNERMESLLKFADRIRYFLDTYTPVGVITCRAMGPHAQVTRFHAACAAVVELTCERREIAYFDIADGTMRKVVLGKGNAKKAEVMEFLGMDNEHAADAMVAALYLQKITV